MAGIKQLSQRQVEMLARIGEADDLLALRFADKLEVNRDLDRTLVSFQANKSEIGHRWCKYREGFSAELIRYLFERTGLNGTILDPFAGSGTALFVAAELGFNSVGIELLPCSAEIIEVRRAVLSADKVRLAEAVRDVLANRPWLKHDERKPYSHIRITEGAFPPENQRQLERLLFVAAQSSDKSLSRLLPFAAMSVLEDISYTRKDGQYLRWDQRSGRCLGKKSFDKGRIYSFDEAISRKLCQIADDVEGRQHQPLLFNHSKSEVTPGDIEIKVGSSLSHNGRA